MTAKQVAIFVSVVLLVAVATYCAFYALGSPTQGVDDANIFFVYAKNFSNGDGIVYNTGGERIEGFSSVVWFLLCSAAFRLLPTAPEPLLGFMSLLFISGALVYATSYLQRISSSREDQSCLIKILPTGLFLAWIAASPSFFVWTVLSLMETGLWVSFVLGSACCLLSQLEVGESGLRKNTFFTALLVCLLLTRPEGPAWVFTLLFVRSISAFLMTGSAGFSLRTLVLPTLVSGLTWLSLTLARLLYFGYPAPNTYYAKVSTDVSYNLQQGFAYCIAFLSSNPILWLGVGLGGGALVLAVKRAVSTVRLPKRSYPDATRSTPESWIRCFALSCLIFAGLVIPILVGGDHFDLFRFYQPLWPLVGLLLALLISTTRISNVLSWLGSFAQSAAKFSAAVTSVAILSLVATLFYFSNEPRWDQLAGRQKIIHEFRIAEDGRLLGELLNHFFVGSELPSIGIYKAGGTAFFYRGESMDLLGINNSHMAHASRERRGVKNHAGFSRAGFALLKPDMLLPGAVVGETKDFLLPEDRSGEREMLDLLLKGLLHDQAFRDEYLPVILWPKNDLRELSWAARYKNLRLFGYLKRPFLVELQENGYPLELLPRRTLRAKH